MDWTPVASRHLSAVAYEDEGKIMGVRFVDGSEYEYHGVPFELVEELMRSPSKGKFFNQHVKGKFDYERIG